MPSFKFMKRITLIVILVITAMMILSSCAPGDAAYYESFYEDMDISVRLEDYLHKAENNDITPFYYDELLTFKEDMSYIPEECDDAAIEVNQNFVACADMLISAFQQNKLGDDEQVAACVKAAWECYHNGMMRYSDYVTP